MALHYSLHLCSESLIILSNSKSYSGHILCQEWEIDFVRRRGRHENPFWRKSHFYFKTGIEIISIDASSVK
jgi:hypothetical protein